MFGLGMIGSTISSALSRLDFKFLADIPFEWANELQMAEAFNAIESVCAQNALNADHLSIVWSAGKSGFYSIESDTDHEFLVFQNVVKFASMARKKVLPEKFSFHCVSSAGGLFEGQRVIRETSSPTPIRPYGHLKKRQEDFLLDCFKGKEVSIYRPSSVYGPTLTKSRHGLINNLICNARNGRVTVLDAHVMSLRDYVFAGDIGNYIGRRIRFGNGSSENKSAHFLVSSKCSSIFEVFEKVKRILNLHAQVRFDDQFGNHKNITFSDSVMPMGWRPVTSIDRDSWFIEHCL
jgi:UDP-glucose 4-epimerase